MASRWRLEFGLFPLFKLNVEELFPKKLDYSKALSMIREVTNKEVKDAISSIGNIKPRVLMGIPLFSLRKLEMLWRMISCDRVIRSSSRLLVYTTSGIKSLVECSKAARFDQSYLGNKLSRSRRKQRFSVDTRFLGFRVLKLQRCRIVAGFLGVQRS
ncbi:hypothetical protein Tco_1061039 [Tanacetum coccineum]